MDGFFSESEARIARPTPTMIPRCDQCGLFRTCMTPKIKPSGTGAKRIMLVGEFPSTVEDKEGKQFSGQHGSFLNRELQSVGIDMRRDCILTNAVICGGAAHHKTAVVDCRPNLLAAIEKHQPNVIVLLGQMAVKSLLGHVWKSDIGPVQRWAGFCIPCHNPNAWIVPVHSVSYLMREDNPVMFQQFRDSLRIAAQQKSYPWEDGPPNYDDEVELVVDPVQAVKRIRSFQGTVSFDFETNCLKPDAKTSQIVCCSICCNGTETIAYPWTRSTADATAEMLEDPDIAKIGYNCKFEDRWVRRKLSAVVQNWIWDGMLSAHALDPRTQTSGLKFQSFVRLGSPDYNYHIESLLQAQRSGGYELNRVRQIKLEHLLKYCAIDSLLEYKVAQHQADEMGVELT